MKINARFEIEKNFETKKPIVDTIKKSSKFTDLGHCELIGIKEGS